MEDSNHKTGIVIFFGVMLLIVGAGLGMWFAINQDNSSANADKVAESQSTVPDVDTRFTTTEVAEHAKTTNCWTIVGDKIYNLTSVIKANPGIPELEQSCGKDGTANISGKSFKTGAKDAEGKAAAQSAADMLSKLQVGRLKK